MQGHKYSHICNLWCKLLPVGVICSTTDKIFIPMVAMYLHARMFCSLTHISSIPMGAMSELETCFEPVQKTCFVTVDDFIALYCCALTHMSSIPMGTMYLYMQEHFLHSLITSHQF